MINHGTKMLLPKGESNSPLVLEMSDIYKAEQRLGDVRQANPSTAAEIMGAMNVAANDAARYISWIQYELLMAKKCYDKRKSILILDELPAYLEGKKIKQNDDIREAFIMKDEEAFRLRDKIDCLSAAKEMIENKLKSFVRAFNAARTIAENRRAMATAPIVSPGANPWHALEEQDRDAHEPLDEWENNEYE